MKFAERVQRFKVRLVVRALRMADGNQARAAAIVGMDENNMYAFVRRHGLQRHTVDRRCVYAARTAEMRA